VAEPTIAEKAEQWREIGKEGFAGVIETIIKSEISKGAAVAIGDIIGVILSTAFTALAPIGVGMAKGMADAEGYIAPAFSDWAADGINDVFGTNISSGSFANARGGGGRSGAGNAVGHALMDQLRGANGPIAPSDEAAAKFVSAMAGIAIEDWFKGWFFEVLSSLVPQLDVGKIENYGALGEKVAQILGLGRISRRVLSPLVDASIVTPFEWQCNKTYQPRLLTPSEAARQVARGRWERERGIEELARQGYSNDRIEAIFNAQRRFFSAADVRTFVNREHWTRDQGIAHLRDQGYEEQTALDALRLEGLRRIDQLEDSIASAVIAAYADGRIDRGQFVGLLNDAISVSSERALLTELADTRRALNVRRLSLSQVEAMVKSGVANMLDYRAAARRDGYPEGDILFLELQLRYEMDKATDIEAARAAALEERALEQQRKAAAADARRQQLEAERALQRRGPLSRLEAAAVRGLIPLSRVEEVLTPEYDPDTVGILLDLVEARRADYVAQQERATRVSAGATARGLNVGELRGALFAQIITVDEFRQRLEQIGLSGDDAAILTATAAADLAARLEAGQVRGEATAVAARRRIDLPRFEVLVRRGARTVTQYDALLADLGFDDVDRAAMVELLQLKIAEDAAARAARDRAAAALEQRGLSLEQLERAVILGVKTSDDYARFLLEQSFTTDAQIALVALLRDRVDEANAARARRQASEGGSGGLALPIATVRRAARLGVIAPDVYTARLAADGYDADDIAIDLELLLLEIAEVQAARATRDEAERAAAVRQLSLADVERAVKRGLAPVEAYRARASELGYRDTDLELLVTLLVDELAELEASRARRAAIDGELRARNLSIGQLEDAVTKGFSTLPAFRDELLRLGYALADAELLTALLAFDLEGAAAPADE
jgi:hypothetical protein